MTAGRSFLQIPGPTNVPERVLRAMDRAVIDHRSPEFAALTRDVVSGLAEVFGTQEGSIAIYPASGTGGWEASLVNVLAPGDRVLMFGNGHFSAGFAQAARRLGFDVDEVQLESGQPVTAADVDERLRADTAEPRYRAVAVVHNETSTGVESDLAAIRLAIDGAGHDALLIVDAVSSLASVPVDVDQVGIDVCLAGSQKGLMLPPGLAVLCLSPRAVAISERGGSPRNYFDWRPILRANERGFYPYTPATLMFFGLQEALRLLREEGLASVYERHRRLAAGVRAAVAAWGLATVCRIPASASQTLTAVVVPEGIDSTALIDRARGRYGLSLGVGLGQLAGRVFRIGHLGALNELEVVGTLGGIEMVLTECGVLTTPGEGVAASLNSFLSGNGVPELHEQPEEGVS
jgi:alanine-glyoxylate transaminase / serine-glyoxylate transaminase / serine-pyruvate transaminase